MVEWLSLLVCLLEIVWKDQMTDFLILYEIPAIWYTPNLKKISLSGGASSCKEYFKGCSSFESRIRIPRDPTYDRYETVSPKGWNLLYSVLVRANALELSVHRSINCLMLFNMFYIFGILWSTVSHDFWVEHNFFVRILLLVRKWAIIICGTRKRWQLNNLKTTWISCVAFPLVCQKPAIKYRNADIKGIFEIHSYRNADLVPTKPRFLSNCSFFCNV